VTEQTDDGKARYLVLNDYGMGGLWWWVRAHSPEEIVETFAEVEVVSRPEAVQRAETWSLDEIDIDTPGPNPLTEFRTQREVQRSQPGFGALAGRERVHLRWKEDEPEDDVRYLLELGPDGRKLRQVEQSPDGISVKTDPDDWPFNPPIDLYDPALAAMEISPQEFEDAWNLAQRDASA
jgi:hypothetical protein